MKPGDVYMLNAPYNGGTHLPDVTVITPVFEQNPATGATPGILFYVGSRGHHADIGGTTPGSMPPDSRVVEEEGVLIDNFLLVDGRPPARTGNRCPAVIRQVSVAQYRRRTWPTCAQ